MWMWFSMETFSFSQQYEESSPPPKRTKRKPKPDPPAKHDPKNEIMKVNLTFPLLWFLFDDQIIYRMSRPFPDSYKPLAERKLEGFPKHFSRHPKVLILIITTASSRTLRVRSLGILILSMDLLTCKRLSKFMAAKPNTILQSITLVNSSVMSIKSLPIVLSFSVYLERETVLNHLKQRSKIYFETNWLFLDKSCGLFLEFENFSP